MEPRTIVFLMTETDTKNAKLPIVISGHVVRGKLLVVHLLPSIVCVVLGAGERVRRKMLVANFDRPILSVTVR